MVVEQGLNDLLLGAGWGKREVYPPASTNRHLVMGNGNIVIGEKGLVMPWLARSEIRTTLSSD